MMHTSVDRYMHRLQFNLVREHGFHFIVAKADRKKKVWKQHSRSRTDLDSRPLCTSLSSPHKVNHKQIKQPYVFFYFYFEILNLFIVSRCCWPLTIAGH